MIHGDGVMERLKSSVQTDASEDPYEVALNAAFNELERVSEELRRRRDRVGELEVRVENLSSLAEKLMAALPPGKRAIYQQRADFKRRSPRLKLGTPVYGNIVQLFKESKQKVWSAPEVQGALDADGLTVDAQQIHNILSYLARRGVIERLSRGRYYIKGIGAGLETIDDLGVEE
jgi:hypothetical protein